MPSLSIVDLSDDVLDPMFECLLPEMLSNSQDNTTDTTRNTRISPPRDLLNCRLVCRLFHQLASPWTWHHAELFIDSGLADSDSSPNSTLIHHREFGTHRALEKAKFFVANSEVARKIRLLHVTSRIETPRSHREDLILTLAPCFSAMRNLQDITIGPLRGDCARPLSELLRHPRLHTVSLCRLPDVSGLHFDEPLTHIRKLSVQDCPSLTNLVSYMPNIEILALREWIIPESIQGPTKIPWNTLRELSITGKILSGRVFRTFEKSPRTPTPIPLESFYINADVLQNQDLCDLFEAMDGQKLRDLSLRKVYGLDLQLLEHIVGAFPHLNHLRVLGQGGLQRWIPGFKPCLAVLRCLTKLRTLDWNCIDTSTTRFERSAYEPLVQIVGKSFPCLDEVQWTDLSHGNFECFQIVRETGHYTAHATKSAAKSELYTPSLHTRFFDCLLLLLRYIPSFTTRYLFAPQRVAGTMRQKIQLLT